MNLNNGGVSPKPANSYRSIRALYMAAGRYDCLHDVANLEPQSETIRAGLAEIFGCDTEEIAITRNASNRSKFC